MRGFAQIQNLVERVALKIVTEEKYGTGSMTPSDYPVPYFLQFPYPKYKSEEYEFDSYL
jgi:hypothetical protein